MTYGNWPVTNDKSLWEPYAIGHWPIPICHLGTVRRSTGDQTKIHSGRPNNCSTMLKRRTISLLLLGFIISNSSARHAGAQTQPELPRVLVIATGGTIAGEQ